MEEKVRPSSRQLVCTIPLNGFIECDVVRPKGYPRCQAKLTPLFVEAGTYGDQWMAASKTIKFLLFNTSVEVNAVNANGFTAMDVLAQSNRGLKDFDIAESLRDAGALRVAEISYTGPRIGGLRTKATPLIAQIPVTPPSKDYVQKATNNEDWLTRKRDALMVVASLIATMAFQAALTPPGGLWQDDLTGTSQGNDTQPHEAGTSIIADKNQSYYSQYLSYNTTSFIASLSIILLLITGLPFKRRLFMWILTVIVWIAITSMALTYRISLLVFTPRAQELNVTQVLEYAVRVWSGVMGFLFLGHTIRLAASLFEKVENVLGKKRKPPPPQVYPPLAQTDISDF
ncbi:PGG domain - like 10 [Theobroma cacao]|nr:PGG domain - like 10 [Theobroma cacao]